MTAYGMDNTELFVRGRGEENVRLYPAAMFTALWLLLFAWAFFGTMTKMIP